MKTFAACAATAAATLLLVAATGIASSRVLIGATKPCNGQEPCVVLRLGSAYSAGGVNELCLYQRDFDRKPQIFCGPAHASAAAYVSIRADRIQVVRFAGSKEKTLFSVAR